MNDTLPAGIHFGISPERYHADPCPSPSLSSSIARLIAERSPRHAWAAHPRLSTVKPDQPTSAMEEGTLLHSMLLGTPQELVEVEADDWRTKAAQTARQQARDNGAIPILTWRMAEMERCVSAFREQLADHECAAALDDGRSEATLIWRESEAWCRARPDFLSTNRRAPLVDIKTTGGSADPDTWEKRLRDDYALQAAFYLRGARACGLDPAGMIFLVIETDTPHGLCAFQPTPDLLAVADEKIEVALDLWETCLRASVWPGYPRRICHVDAPNWLLARAEERAQARPQRMAAVKPTPAQIERANAMSIRAGRLAGGMA